MIEPAATPKDAAAGVRIIVDRVSKRLGGREILRDVELDIRAGEVLTLLGPSGSGKTTLLMTIAGFARPDGGAIWFGARDVTNMPPFRRAIGVVFQSYALFPHMNVGENIAYPLALRGIRRAQRIERTERALATVRLEGFAERAIASLSGGQKQRVALARAIVFEPQILLMDEPLSALDKPLRDAMQVELRRLHTLLGITTVYVTHDQREALSLSDRIAVMNHGEIVQIGKPMDLYRRPRTTFVARFLGESNLLTVVQRGADVWCEGRPIQIPTGAAVDRQLLLIRPEQFVRLESPSEAASSNRFDGIVDDMMLQGDSQLMTVRLPSGRIILFREVANRRGAETCRVGDAIALGVDPSDCILVDRDTADLDGA